MKLNAHQLAQLAAALQAVKRGDPKSLPRSTLARLSAALPAGVGMTIDFDAGAALGHPIVVLRPVQEHGVGVGTAEAGGDVEDTFSQLTPREREVAGFVATGLRNQDIAIALDISLSTTKDYVHRILRKTGLDSRTAVAVAWNRAER